MSASTDLLLAHAVLALHVVVIAFNVGGLIVVPLGAWRGWGWVRGCAWRALHLAALVVVAAQAVLGRACFLTDWESDLLQRAGHAGYSAGLIQTWVDRLIYWPLPLWVFTLIYVAVGIYTVALWFAVPPRCRRARPQPASKASSASPPTGASPQREANHAKGVSPE